MNNADKYFWITLLQNCSFLSPVMTLFYIHRGLQFSDMFLLLLAVVVSMFIFEVPTGIFGDKYGRKNSIIIGLFMLIIMSTLLVFAHSLWFFLVIMILLGCALTFGSGSDEALIYDSLKEEGKEKEMNKYMSKINSARFIPIVVTAPIGAFIAKDLTENQFMILLILGIIISLIAFIIGLTLKETTHHKTAKKDSPIKLFKSSLVHIKNSPIILRLFINKTLVLIVCSHVFGVLWQPYLQESGVPIALFGILVSMGALIISYLNHKIMSIQSFISTKRILFLTALFSFAAFLIGAYVQNIYYAIAFYLIIRVLLWVRDPLFSQYLNEHIESHNRATVLSSLSMVDSFFDIIIFLLAGYISNIGLNYSFLFCAGVILIAMLFFRIEDKHMVVKTKE
jgi:MFS family permease